jgi:hypothetical protein
MIIYLDVGNVGKNLMNKSWFIIALLGLSLLLSGCAAQQVAPTPTDTPIPLTATHTATATYTPLPPTATFTHTPTATRTATNTPTATYTLTPTVTNTLEPTTEVNVCATRPAVAEGPNAKLTIVNKSGYDVYMKLESCGANGAFYYLTIPAGTPDDPTIKVFTVFTGAYKSTTYQCNGVENTNLLVISGAVRLNFVSCGSIPAATMAP